MCLNHIFRLSVSGDQPLTLFFVYYMIDRNKREGEQKRFFRRLKGAGNTELL